MQWLHDEDFRSRCSHVPHLEFAVAIEDQLKVYANPDTGKTEYYDDALGRWMPEGGAHRVAGEDLAIPLINTFTPHKLVYEEREGKTKVVPRPVKWDDSRFRNAPFTAPIATMVKSLKVEHTIALDSSTAAVRIRNFMGGMLLDFNLQPPVVDWDNDHALDAALQRPIRNATKDDRLSRYIPVHFQEYRSEHRFDLARIIERTCRHLATDDVLSDELKEEWDRVLPRHEGSRRIVFEAHRDHDSFFMQLRIIFENACGETLARMEHSTWRDDEDGSTGKGTGRSWIEAANGTFNGGEQRGYSAVITQAALAPKGRNQAEGPKEQFANLEGCCFAFCDDFKANSKNPLDNAVLRQISGKNLLTAARKGKGERCFVFNGHLILLCNGTWVPDDPFIEADGRRMTGLHFPIKYKNKPQGPNEAQKDANLKHRVHELIPEFWFLARVFWLCTTPHPEADVTLPKCPCTELLVQEMSNTTA